MHCFHGAAGTLPEQNSYCEEAEHTRRSRDRNQMGAVHVGWGAGVVQRIAGTPGWIAAGMKAGSQSWGVV